MRTYDPGKTPSTGQRRPAADRTAAPGPRLHAAVRRSAVDDVARGPGQPLGAPFTGEMKGRPGADFSRVPVHADSADKDILALQRSVGNAAVSRMLEQGGRQHGAGGGHQQAAPAPVQRSAVQDVLSGSGQPLGAPLREEMEARLGADFSGVRVHTGEAARASAAEVGARAYTVGDHVVLGHGGADKQTFAHELTHVIQQRQGPVAGIDHGSGFKVSDPSDVFEKAAQANAARVMRGPLSQHRQPSASPRPVGKTIIQRMIAKDARTRLNDLDSLNTALHGLDPVITDVSDDLLATPGASRPLLDQAIKKSNFTLYDSMEREDLLGELTPVLEKLVDEQPAAFTYDVHGNKHFSGGTGGTKFVRMVGKKLEPVASTVVNPQLVSIITPLVGRIRRDANGRNQTYYLTHAGITQCPTGYDLTIQIDFNFASDEITYHGYPDNTVTAHSLSRTKSGRAIP